jgi:hypothetical protein
MDQLPHCCLIIPRAVKSPAQHLTILPTLLPLVHRQIGSNYQSFRATVFFDFSLRADSTVLARINFEIQWAPIAQQYTGKGGTIDKRSLGAAAGVERVPILPPIFSRRRPMLLTLPWFPPAPAAGPASILSLPPDVWVMQPKIDGIRVIIYGAEPFNRLGQPLSESKGAAALRAMFKGVVETLDGEWVPKKAKYYAFDLPDAAGDFDERVRTLRKLEVLRRPGVMLVDTYEGHFARIYASLPRETTEGVVFKRRRSLYAKHVGPGVESRDWLKRRFLWD